MEEKLLLLHSIPDVCGCGDIAGVRRSRRRVKTGGSKMGRTCVSYRNVYSPTTGGYVRRCARFSGSGLSGLGEFGQVTTLRGTFDSVKDVLINGGIAAGGAYVADKLWGWLGGTKLALKPEEQTLAIMATGVGVGLIVAKVAKKPRIGAALAVGPVAVGFLRLLGTMLGTPTAGLGYMVVTPPGWQPAIRQPIGSIPMVNPAGQAPEIPEWMRSLRQPAYTI